MAVRSMLELAYKVSSVNLLSCVQVKVDLMSFKMAHNHFTRAGLSSKPFSKGHQKERPLAQPRDPWNVGNPSRVGLSRTLCMSFQLKV